MKKLIVFFILFLVGSFFATCKKEHNTNNNPNSNPGTSVYTDNSYLLRDSIVDAEYTRSKDLLIAITTSPDSLLIIDPVNKVTQSLPLVYPPTCVSISPDGNYFVVGYNGYISFFDLNTRALINTLSTSFNAGDIVLTNNKWAYILPGTGSTNMKCINLTTGFAQLNSGSSIMYGAKAKLHASGNFLYVINSNLEKENISSGVASFMYQDNDYNYSIFSDLWMFEDSSRMLVQAANVFHTTSVQNTDMNYSGSLGPVGASSIGYAVPNVVYTADYSKIANRVYAVLYNSNPPHQVPDTIVKKFTGDYLSYKGYINLPKLIIANAVPNKPCLARGHFGFFNSQGTKFHVIVNGKDSLGTHKKWALVSLDVN